MTKKEKEHEKYLDSLTEFCNKCREWRSPDEFIKSNRYCGYCRRKNKIEFSEPRRRANEKYRKSHMDIIRKQDTKRKRKNRRIKAWELKTSERWENKEAYDVEVKRKKKRNIHIRNYKLLKRTNGTGVSVTRWEEILSKYNHRCAYCGITAEGTKQKYLTQEHIIPISKKGEHSPYNVVPACVSCNSSKWNKNNHS